jgi:translation initiation factor IF-3
MKQFKAIVLLLIVSIFSCSKKNQVDETIFDSSFNGARLNSIENLGDNKYIAQINPAFEPANKSPYLAFSVIAKSKKEIELQLDYGKYQHRYIPKLSFDKKTWKNIEISKIKIDTSTGIATLKLTVLPQKLYLAAQEIETSQDTYLWLGSMLNKHQFLKKEIAGKTAKKQNNYVVTSTNNTKKGIALIARQHPPETPGGTIGFKAFFEELVSDTEIAKKFRNEFTIYTFPLLNPDGADLGNWRHNANGIDLNRDWINFTQPETQMVKTFFAQKVKEGNAIEFAIDFHTSYSGPYLLVLDSINETKTKGIIPNWIKNIESNSQFKVEARKRSQELPYCYNYFYNQLGCEAVTYEDGDEIDRNIIKKRATVYAKEFMKTMLLKYYKNEL